MIQMDAKQIISQIREAVGAELEPKIKGFLSQLESGYNDLSDDLKAANAESKERKLKLRELTAQHEEAIAKLKDVESKTNDPKVAEEMAALKTFRTETLKRQKDSLILDLGKIEKHPAYEKAKDLFKLPKPDKDGKVDLTKMSDDELVHNINKLSELNKLGLFENVGAPPADPFNMPRNPDGTGKPPTIRNRDDLLNAQGAILKTV
jgi:hypothetical protein